MVSYRKPSFDKYECSGNIKQMKVIVVCCISSEFVSTHIVRNASLVGLAMSRHQLRCRDVSMMSLTRHQFRCRALIVWWRGVTSCGVASSVAVTRHHGAIWRSRKSLPDAHGW